MNKMYLVIGDWSGDGHDKYQKILVEVNKTVEEVQNAYKKSCKLTGISFNGNEDYTERYRNWEEADYYQIAVNYEEYKLSEGVLSVLKEFKCPQTIIDNYNDDAVDGYLGLWLWFVNLSLKDLQYNKLNDSIPNINGFWDKNLNVSFGYGLYL